MSSGGSTRGRFRLGINYWPARTAMEWWRTFELPEVAADFARIAERGFDSIRIFLRWEDFQPTPGNVNRQMVDRLVDTLEIALGEGLAVMPTLFTGHMSGVNYVPAWALGGEEGEGRFRVVSHGAVVPQRPRCWYGDEEIVAAQSVLAHDLAGALAGHEALLAWDLGNENSNVTVPPNKALARAWLGTMTGAIRAADPGARVTIGLHMEDLESDRSLGPKEAAEFCDLLTMHGYPGYASWAAGPTDERLLPFLAILTRWLGGGAEVCFTELGAPTYRATDPEAERARAASSSVLVEEGEVASYVERALTALHACGCSGAMLWCYADYARALWEHPPLELATHERSFGLWRADGSPKPAVGGASAFAARRVEVQPPADASRTPSWVDVDADEFYRAPALHMPRLFARFSGEPRTS